MRTILLHGASISKSLILPIGKMNEETQEARNKDIKKHGNIIVQNRQEYYCITFIVSSNK